MIYLFNNCPLGVRNNSYWTLMLLSEPPQLNLHVLKSLEHDLISMRYKSTLYLHASVSPIPSACSNMAMGIPTFFERPHTTAFLPKVSTPEMKHSDHKYAMLRHNSFFY